MSICSSTSQGHSLRKSSPVWVSEVSLAARSRVLARLASLAQMGELALRLARSLGIYKFQLAGK